MLEDSESMSEVSDEEEDPFKGEAARESLRSLGLNPDEGQEVPDYDQTIKMFKEGDIVNGVVVKVDKEEVLLDIGFKSEGVIPSRELSIRHDVKPSDIVQVGDELEALVLQKEDKEGRLILSKKRAQYERAWNNIERIKEQDGVVEGEVIEVVKGGLILDIGLRGFLPASLVEMRRVKDLTQYVGRSVEAKIIELDKNRNNVVLSRRAHLEKQKSNERKDFLEGLQKGTRSIGTVSSIVNFGAFVDLGGVDGLIHISELSWSHVDHPSEVLVVGQEVGVEILDVDLDRERVSLSLKKAQEDPWEKLAKEKPAGSTVTGKVTKIVPFGAFVEIAPGVEGLVHISELAWEHVELPEEVVSVGEQVDAKIIDIDLERRRISLSLKQISGPGEQEYDEAGELVGSSEPDLVEAGEYESGGEVEAGEPEEPVDHQEIATAAAELAAQVDAIEIDVNAQEENSEPPAAEIEAEDVEEVEVELEVVEEASVEPEPEPLAPAEAVEETPREQPEASGETDSSLESILADMRRKGQDD